MPFPGEINAISPRIRRCRCFLALFQVYMSSIRKLEVSLFKYYVANAVQNNKLDKVNEFYEKCTVDLQHQGEWKDWFSE